MNEATFSRNFMKAWAEHGPKMYFHRIADVPMSRIPGDFKKITRAVDYLAYIRGLFVALEWKIIQPTRTRPIRKSFSFDAVRPIQYETLISVEASGGIGLLMIGQYKDRSSSVYAIPINDLLRIQMESLAVGRKSVKLADIDQWKMERTPVGRKQAWLFDDLLTGMIDKKIGEA